MSVDYLKKYLKEDLLEEGIKKFNEGIPVQYIVGSTNFYGYNIKVNENVLIPRFETEELVENTIKYIKDFKNSVSILDLCTGSGCIAITLKKELNCNVDATDISNKALEVAKENALLNDASINFYQGDLFENINKKYDVIISNPPYIDIKEEVMDLVKNNEPHLALYALDNGLYFYKKILDECSNYLNNEFLIAFEIGHTQGDFIKNYALSKFSNIKVDVKKDLQGKDRFVFIKSR